MNAFTKHIRVVRDTPIFATSLAMLRWWNINPDENITARHKKENDMMESRWRHFELTYKFKEEEKVTDIPKCSKCFAELVLLGDC